MSVSVRINVRGQDDYELEAKKTDTIDDLVAKVISREGCAEEDIEIRMDGKLLDKGCVMKDLGETPTLHVNIKGHELGQHETISKIPTGPSFFKNISMSQIFEVGEWVETPVKNSILIDNKAGEWCLGKILSDTGRGYEIEIFESYKFFMPSKVKVNYNEVRRPKYQSVSLAQLKLGEVDSDEDDDDQKFYSKVGRLAKTKPRSQSLYIHKKKKRRSWSRENEGPELKSIESSSYVQRRSSKNILSSRRPKRRGSGDANRGWRKGKAKSYAGFRSESSLSIPSANYRSKVRELSMKFPDIDPKEVKMYVRLFRSELDKTKKGVITKRELDNWIKRNNIEFKGTSLEEILNSLKIDKREFDMESFIDIMCSSNLNDKDRDIRKLFKQFDLNEEGVITAKALKKGMKDIFNKDVSDDKLAEMIKEADSSGTGTICFKDFREMMSF